MTVIIDLELTVRIGALDTTTAAAVEAQATRAFLWRGLSTEAALDLARGPHWTAVGLPADPSSRLLVATLDIGELNALDRNWLVAALAAAEAEHEAGTAPADPLGRGDSRFLGRRIGRALALLERHDTAAR